MYLFLDLDETYNPEYVKPAPSNSSFTATDFASFSTSLIQSNLISKGADDEHGDTFATATIVGINQGLSGQIHAFDDVDIIRLDLTNELVALRYSSAPDTVAANVYRADGSLFATLTQDEALWVNSDDGAFLYVGVTGADQDTYELDFGAAPIDIAADINTDIVLQQGEGTESYSHGLDDQDWFRLRSGTGETLQFAIEVTDSSAQPNLQIVDQNGNVLAEGISTGPGISDVRYTAQSNDTLYLVATPSAVEGTAYSIFQPIDNDDYPADSSTTGFLAIGDTLSGIINQDGDFDWVGFDGEAGQVLKFTLTLDGNGIAPQFTIVDEQGLFAADPIIADGANDDSIDFNVTVPETGRFYVSFTIDPGQAQSTNYTLSLEESTDVAGNQTSAERLAIGERYEGIVDGDGDQDWIGVELEAGVTYQIVERSHGDVFNTIGIFNSSGDSLASFSGSLSGNFDPVNYTYTAETDGLHFIALINFDVERSGVDRSYTLDVAEIVDDYGDDQQSASSVDFEAGIDGQLEYDGDTDWFSVELGAYDGLILHSDEVNGLAFYDTNGQFYSDPFFRSLGADQAGTYFVEVNSAVGDFDSARDYSIIAERLVDEAAGSTATTASISDNSVITGILTGNADQDWYAFNASVGQVLLIELGGTNQNFNFTLYDANGVEFGTSTTGLFEATFNVAGTYYLAVSTFISPGAFGDYRISTGTTVGVAIDGTLDADIVSLTNLGDTYYAYSGNDTISGGAGNDIVSLGTGRDVFVKTEGSGADTVTDFDARLDKIDIAVSPDLSFEDVQALLSTSGNDTLITLTDGSTVRLNGVGVGELNVDNFLLSGVEITPPNVNLTEQSDDYSGTGANDVINGLGGNDVINGLAGNDTLLGDTARSLTLDDAEGQLFRAFQAVFDRAPDAAGFNAFLTEMRLGNTTQEMVIAEFVTSTEFQNTFGELDNRGFVEQLYRNVLDREGDADGITAFTAAINAGTTRAAVVTEFANSAEFVQLMTIPSAAFATNVIINPAEAQVFRIYQAVFLRDPDEGGFTAFTNSIQADLLTVEQITAEFVASDEFQQTYGSLDNENFVELLFTNVLPGNMDSESRAAFTTALDSGSLTRAGMVAEFVESFEFVQRMEDLAEAFVATTFTSSADTLDGGIGNDLLFGGRGADTFVFDTRDGGSDIILDFTVGTDRLDIISGSSFDNFAGIMAVGGQIGQDTLFEFGDDTFLWLNNVDFNDLTEEDFGFTPEDMSGSDPSTEPVFDPAFDPPPDPLPDPFLDPFLDPSVLEPPLNTL